jgi:hypothetical protein
MIALYSPGAIGMLPRLSMATSDKSSERELIDLTDRAAPLQWSDDELPWVPAPAPLVSISPLARDEVAKTALALPPPIPPLAVRPAATPPPELLRAPAPPPPSIDDDVPIELSDPETQIPALPPLPRPRERRATLPPPSRATLTGLAPAPTARPPTLPPLTLPPLPAPEAPAKTRALDDWSFDDPTPLPRPIAQLDESREVVWQTPAARFARVRPDARKLLRIAAIAGVASFVVFYLLLRSGSSEPTANEPPAATPPARVALPAAKKMPLAAPAPAPEPPSPPRAVLPSPHLVDVPIATTPSGAAITVIDDGHAHFAGSTPATLALDPAREYDLVLALADHPTRVEHIRVVEGAALDFALAPTKAKPVAKRSAAKPVAAAPTAPTPKPKTVAATPATAPAPARDQGVLMISTKPPCKIFVDGRPTNLTTPQRNLRLAAGKHKVELVNAQQRVDRTIDVQIVAGRPTKVVQDFMRR